MDAILGRYRVYINNTGLVLNHPAGISFDITANEALAFLKFLESHQHTLFATQSIADSQESECSSSPPIAASPLVHRKLPPSSSRRDISGR
jgi:hypothetical protein